MSTKQQFVPLVGQEGDFEQQVRLYNEALYPYGENMPPIDEFDALANARETAIREDSQDANFVRTAPKSIYRAQLGGSQKVISEQPLIQLVNWTGEEDAECSPMTVTLSNNGYIPPGQLPDGTFVDGYPATGQYALFRPYARVIWGTKGVTSIIEVDLNRGCQFTVGGSSIQVLVGLPDATWPGQAHVYVAMQLSAMLSFFPTQKLTQVTRTQYYDALLAGAKTGRVVIPAFAQAIAYVDRSDMSEPLQMAFFGANPSSGQIGIKNIPAGQTLVQVPIFNEAYAWEIKNISPAVTQNIRVIWALCV